MEDLIIFSKGIKFLFSFYLIGLFIAFLYVGLVKVGELQNEVEISKKKGLYKNYWEYWGAYFLLIIDSIEYMLLWPFPVIKYIYKKGKSKPDKTNHLFGNTKINKENNKVKSKKHDCYFPPSLKIKKKCIMCGGYYTDERCCMTYLK